MNANQAGSATSIGERLRRIQERAARAALAAGFPGRGPRIVAVSKRQPIEKIREAYAAGQRDFGENYVQDLVTRSAALADLGDLRWHMIGHVQRNKARLLVPLAHYIHTVDSAKLAVELGKRQRAADPQAPGALRALVEVNIAGDSNKSGCSAAEVGDVLAAVEAEPGLELCGLMTVPPVEADPGRTRAHFEALRALRDANGGVERLPELSMGMSDDFELAIQAGATMVRVGTAIFGPREQ